MLYKYILIMGIAPLMCFAQLGETKIKVEEALGELKEDFFYSPLDQELKINKYHKNDMKLDFYEGRCVKIMGKDLELLNSILKEMKKDPNYISEISPDYTRHESDKTEILIFKKQWIASLRSQHMIINRKKKRIYEIGVPENIEKNLLKIYLGKKQRIMEKEGFKKSFGDEGLYKGGISLKVKNGKVTQVQIKIDRSVSEELIKKIFKLYSSGERYQKKVSPKSPASSTVITTYSSPSISVQVLEHSLELYSCDIFISSSKEFKND